MQVRVVLAAVMFLAAVGCSKRSGGGAGGGGGEGTVFEQRWATLAQQGTKPFLIEDDRGAGLMGNVLGAQQGAVSMAAALAQSYKGGTRLPETPDGEEVKRAVRQYLPGVKSCYLRMTREGPAPSGKALVSFQIAGNGRVQALNVDAPAFEGTALPACISAQVTRWVFPPSRNGMPAVSYPFVFVGT